LTANITAAALTVSGVTANNKVYDGTTAATINTNGYTLNGLAGGDTGKVLLATNGYTATFASAGTNNGIGVTVSGLTLTGSAAPNYALTQPTGLTANIGPAALTVRADDKTRGFGSANPAFTATFTGLQNGDNITAAFSCDALAASPPGTYPIVPTLVDPDNRQSNYVVSLVNGTLTVTAVATPRTVMVEEAYSSPGSLVAVGVYLAAQGDENSVAFSLAFDPALLPFMTYIAGSGIPTGSTISVDTNTALSGALGVQLSLPAGATFQSGTQQMVVVTFQVSPTITSATNLPVSLADQPEIREVAATNADLLPANYIAGAVSVFTGFEGDADGDGSLSPNDWTLVGLFVAGLRTNPPPDQFMRMDCAPRSTKGDGQLSAADWTQAGRYVLGLDPIETIGGPGEPLGSLTFAAKATARDLEGQTGRALRLIGTGAEAGTIVQVPVEMTGLGDENTLGFSVTFDPAELDFVSAVPGSGLLSGAQLILNTKNAAAGCLGVLIGAPPGEAFGAGTNQVLVLSLRVKPGKGPVEVAFGDSPVRRQFVSADAEVLSGDFINAVIILGTMENILQLDVSQINDAGARLSMSGTPGRSYQIMVSTNLTNWTVLTTVTATSTGLVEASDAEAKQYSMRFYRAVAN
jgi:hypothetical protein